MLPEDEEAAALPSNDSGLEFLGLLEGAHELCQIRNAPVVAMVGSSRWLLASF